MTTTAMLELHTLREGSGLPLVLLHGYPVDHRMWSDVADALPAGTAVLALDLPGLGGSPDGTEPASLDASADAVVGTLRAAGYDRAVVAGLSMGGYVALAIAERHPDFAVALGLVDSKSTADTEDARANRLRIAKEVAVAGSVDSVLGAATSLLGATSQATRPALVARLEEWIGAQRPDGVAWSQRAMASRPDRTGVLASFAGPVTVVVGEEDVTTPAAEAEHMASAARAAELVRIPAAGHMSAVEQPEAVAAAIADLVARVMTR